MAMLDQSVTGQHWIHWISEYLKHEDPTSREAGVKEKRGGLDGDLP